MRCLSKNSKLTPRLVALLHILMDHHGEVVEREHLFKKVWETDYTGDTRTLDVHISWLRRAIELDPLKPKFLKTIRGVGYRLDVNPEMSRGNWILLPLNCHQPDANIASGFDF